MGMFTYPLGRRRKSQNWNVTAIILDFPLQPYYVLLAIGTWFFDTIPIFSSSLSLFPLLPSSLQYNFFLVMSHFYTKYSHLPFFWMWKKTKNINNDVFDEETSQRSIDILNILQIFEIQWNYQYTFMPNAHTLTQIINNLISCGERTEKWSTTMEFQCVCVYVHVKTNGSKKKTKPTPALGYSVAHWVQSRCVNRIYGIYKPFRGSALKRNIQVERQQQQQQQKRNKTNENNISSEQEKCAPRSLLFFALQFTFFIMHIFEQVASLS